MSTVTTSRSRKQVLNEQYAQLDALRIDRNKIETKGPRPRIRTVCIYIVLISTGAIVIWNNSHLFPKFRQLSTSSLANTTSSVSITSQNVDVTPTSTPLVEASGYVVARRSATVSAKIVGQLKEILFEEGDFVEAKDSDRY